MKTSFLRPLRLLVFFPCYAGNGGYASLSIRVAEWWTKTKRQIEDDPRIGEVRELYLADTPITMTRNAAVEAARQEGFDLLLMVDSDMHPDFHLGKAPDAKPFWPTAFDFVYERMRKDLPTVAFAPYCGPGPNQNVYVFQWKELSSDSEGRDSGIDQQRLLTLEPYDRQHAAELSGILPAAAGPTGLILYTIDSFDCRQPCDAHKPPFYYEWEDDRTASRKASTEDVTNTRDSHLGGHYHDLGDVVFCCWDSWGGHIKQETVGKPFPIGTSRGAQKILAQVARDEDRKATARRESLRKRGFIVDEPTDAADPPAPETAPLTPAVPVATETPYPIADERLHPTTLATIERCIEQVLDARHRRKGDIIVCDERDLAVTRTAVDAVLRRRGLDDDDVHVYFSFGPRIEPREKAAIEQNGPELDKQFKQTGVPRVIEAGLHADGMRWDNGPVHLVLDLRREAFSEPVARNAYAYLSLTEPIGWRHREDIHYRQDRSVKNVWFGINEDKVTPKEDAPDERELVGT